METRVRLDARAAFSTYVVFGFIFGWICGVPIGISHDPKIVVPFSVMLVVSVIWIRMFRVIVDGTSYVSLFGGKQTVDLNEIASAKTEVGVVKKSFRPTCRLILERRGRADKQEIIINMKVFRREDMVTLIGILGEKVDGHPGLSMFGSRK